MSARERKPRESKFHQVGEIGRTTGILAPNHGPRDSNGLELPAAFFSQPSPAQINHQSNQNNNNNNIQSQPSITNYTRQTQSQSLTGNDRRFSEMGAARGRDRPDKFVELGERGRKTGVVKQLVQQDESGFEDVAEFFAASSSPNKSSNHIAKKTKPVNLLKNRVAERSLEEEEEYDEMEIDTGSGTSPIAAPTSSRSQYQSNLQQTRVSGATARALDSPTGEVDWDALPVPGQTSSGRKRGRSSMGSTITASSNNTGARMNGGGVNGRESIGSPLGSVRGKLDKGKGRAARSPSLIAEPEFGHDQEEEQEFFDEQDYGGGEGEVVLGDDDERYYQQERDRSDSDDDGMEVISPTSSAIKITGSSNGVKSASKKVGISAIARKRARSLTGEEGTRKSTRQKVAPVEYWRNERIVYARRESGIGIKTVVRIAKEPGLPFHQKKRGAGRLSKRFKSEDRDHASRRKRDKSEEGDEEDGVDDMTDPDGVVWSWEGEAEITRRIAFTSKMIDPRPTYNNKFMFQKIFTELDYLAGGILQIPAGAEKPSKPAKDNSYMFYCIEGAVSVTVHRTRFAIGPGATFFVPRGNSYSITATSNRDVKLFFTQGRRVMESSDGTAIPDMLRSAKPPRRTVAAEESEEDVEEEEEGEEEEEEEEEGDETGSGINQGEASD